MTDTPDISMYYLVHRAIRSDAQRFAAAMRDLTEHDRRRIATIRWWWRGFSNELHNHHSLEDTIFFPALAERVPAFVEYERGLADDHAHLDEVISLLDDAVHGLSSVRSWATHHAVAVELATELAEFLGHHLALEDADILPLFTRHFSAAEYDVLDRRAIKATRPVEIVFTCPWLLIACTPAERADLLAHLPAFLRVVWRLTGRRHARRTTLAFGSDSIELAQVRS
jgi:hemerythrin-like domain-containing protein